MSPEDQPEANEADESKLTGGQLDAFLADASDSISPDGDTVSQKQTAKDPESISEPIPEEGVELIPGYVVLDILGKGGMGVVYRARQKNLRREVAIKTLLMSLLSNKNAAARFEREAMIVAQLRHPNIVTAFDFGRSDEQLYLVMEMLIGETISDLLNKQDTFDEATAWGIARQTASALAHAAEFGIVHRDIKPANIFLVNPPLGVDLTGCSKLVKVTDFGIASVEQADLDEERLTANHSILGTPRYMAPEQCYGGDVTLHADIYSLGATVYHMLAGFPPFGNRFGPKEFTKFMMYRAAHRPDPVAESIEGVSRESDALLLQMLSPNPDDRPQSYAELLEQIEGILGRSDSRSTMGIREQVSGTANATASEDDASSEKSAKRTISNAPDSTEPDASRRLVPSGWLTKTRLSLATFIALVGAIGIYWWGWVLPPNFDDIKIDKKEEWRVYQELRTERFNASEENLNEFRDLEQSTPIPVIEHKSKATWKISPHQHAAFTHPFIQFPKRHWRVLAEVDLSECDDLNIRFSLPEKQRARTTTREYFRWPHYRLEINRVGATITPSVYFSGAGWFLNREFNISASREHKWDSLSLGKDGTIELEIVRWKKQFHLHLIDQNSKHFLGEVKSHSGDFACIVFSPIGGPAYFHRFEIEALEHDPDPE